MGVDDAVASTGFVGLRLGPMVGEGVATAVEDGLGVWVSVAPLDSSDVRVGTRVTSGVVFIAVAGGDGVAEAVGSTDGVAAPDGMGVADGN